MEASATFHNRAPDSSFQTAGFVVGDGRALGNATRGLLGEPSLNTLCEALFCGAVVAVLRKPLNCAPNGCWTSSASSSPSCFQENPVCTFSAAMPFASTALEPLDAGNDFLASGVGNAARASKWAMISSCTSLCLSTRSSRRLLKLSHSSRRRLRSCAIPCAAGVRCQSGPAESPSALSRQVPLGEVRRRRPAASWLAARPG
mmetsp:Transcript_100422/g.288540  ORF Transcript_100422/g.288540 Transcript_100422/m.288540 type:complete len:202 (-) Transcript_100422:30-635(-)